MKGNPLDYRGRTVVFTGAAGGIGRGSAQAFAEAGTTLEPLDRDAAALGAQVEVCAPDLASRATAVDLLINNAGVKCPTPLVAAVTGQALSASRGEVMH